MASPAFKTITLYPSAPVATNGTMTFTYASGDQTQFQQSGETMVLGGLMDVLTVGAGKFSLSYGGSSVVATYLGATTIPAGSKVVLQLPLAVYSALTDSTGGAVSNTLAAITAGGSYAQADMTAAKNAIASLAAKVNMLLALSKNNDYITGAQ